MGRAIRPWVDINRVPNGFVRIKLDTDGLGSSQVVFGWTWVDSDHVRMDLGQLKSN